MEPGHPKLNTYDAACPAWAPDRPAARLRISGTVKEEPSAANAMRPVDAEQDAGERQGAGGATHRRILPSRAGV